MVLVPVYHIHHAGYMGCSPSGIFGQTFRSKPKLMSLHICLINNQDSILVAELIEGFASRHMGRTDRVDIDPLHSKNLLPNPLPGDIFPGKRIVLHTADAFQFDGLAVEVEDTVSHFEFAESYSAVDNVQGLPLPVRQDKNQPVQIRSFIRPFRNLFHHPRQGEGFPDSGPHDCRIPGQSQALTAVGIEQFGGQLYLLHLAVLV